MSESARSLARFPLFAGLDPRDAQALDARCVWRRFAAGEWVIGHQAQETDVFFVLSGRGQIVIPAPSREIIFGDLGEGEFMGELSAIDGEPRSAGIRAVTDMLVARMSGATFREAVDRHFEVRDRLMRRLAAEIRALVNRASERASLNVRARLCAELLRLSRASAQGRVVVSPPPTHAELAARIGSHREAVTKLLGALAREGLIARSRGSITLADLESMRMIAGGRRDEGSRINP